MLKANYSWLVAATTLLLLINTTGWAQNAHRRMPHHSHHPRHVNDKLVAYDAKDKRYYSVAYAKAHGMHDRGGDKLILIRKSRLPKNARLSRAMKGVEP